MAFETLHSDQESQGTDNRDSWLFVTDLALVILTILSFMTLKCPIQYPLNRWTQQTALTVDLNDRDWLFNDHWYMRAVPLWSGLLNPLPAHHRHHHKHIRHHLVELASHWSPAPSTGLWLAEAETPVCSWSLDLDLELFDKPGPGPGVTHPCNLIRLTYSVSPCILSPAKSAGRYIIITSPDHIKTRQGKI